MKLSRYAVALFLIISLLIIPVNGSWGGCDSLSHGLEIISAGMCMTVSETVGNDIKFSSDIFRDGYLLDKALPVIITVLPAKDDGVLSVSGQPVYPGQELSGDSLSSLTFTPSDGCTESSFGFTFDGSYSAECRLRFTDKVNFAPYTEETAETWTCSDVFCTGMLNGTDPDGDAVRYELVTPPQFGIVEIEDDRAYRYTPYEGAYGNDSFGYRVVDEFGNTSAVSTVNVRVAQNNYTAVISDISDSPCGASVLEAVSDGIMKTLDNGGSDCFDPSGKVSRLDFLVWSMDSFGAQNVPEIRNTGFDDDQSIPAREKGYVFCAAELGIIEKDGNFAPDANITYAEAAEMLNGILGMKPFVTAVSGSDTNGKTNDVAALTDNGIMSAYTDPQSELDRCHCAELLCNARRFFK